MSIEETIGQLSRRATATAWVISDLQQSDPAQAQRCLRTALDDMRDIGTPFHRIWYLGDAVEGSDRRHLEEMVAMQIEELGKFHVPLLFVPGNHDFDFNEGGRRKSLFREAVSKTTNWVTTESDESLFVEDSWAGHRIIAMADHVCPRGSWACTHGIIHGALEAYPYGQEAYRHLRERMAVDRQPVITLSHYSFPGGNRPSPLFERLMPLPLQVRLHLYGHAHIGDVQWAGKDAFRTISGVDGYPVHQIDVASLEDRRGSAVRSVLLDILPGGAIAVRFRNHTHRQWTGLLML